MEDSNETKPENRKDFHERLRQQSAITAARWKNRRRMAWVALFAMLVVTYWALFVVSLDRLKQLDDIITWFYLTMGSIIGAYVGFSTFDDKWKNK